MIKIESTATNSYPGIQIVNDAQTWEISTHGAHSDALTFYNGTNHTMKLETSGTIVANLKGTASTTAATGLIIHGGAQYDETEGGVGGAANTFVTNMNRQIVLQFRAGASSGYAHAINTRHNSGGRGGNTIDFYNWEYGTSSDALPTKRSFSIHPKAIELVPTTSVERDLFNSYNLAYDGMLLYNSDEKKFQGRIDGAWKNIAAGDDLPVTTNLYARYTADSFTNNGASTAPSWSDLSGNGRDITTTSTSTGGGFWARSGSTWPTKVSSNGVNGALSSFNCVQFGINEALALPAKSGIAAAATTGFTFAYVARYINSTNDKRIMAASGSNNLVGFWDGKRGVFYDGAWIVGASTQHSTDATDWTIIIMSGNVQQSKTKDNNSGNFVSNSATFNYTNSAYSATGARYGLNYHDHGLGGNSSERSDFELAEWSMWDRTLTSSEITSLQSFLETKYGI